ncbi:MAG: Mbeg1-like protein [Lachnoanaerobaculum saburreum]
MASDRPTDEELQEKALYDIIQYLPLDSLDIYNNDSINNIVNNTVKKGAEWKKIKSILDKEEREEIEAKQKAIEEYLPAIEAILKDRPELGKARISNMSWKDNNGDKKQDHSPKGMQACTFERGDQVYISFRGTPARSWLDNAKAFVEDLYTGVFNLGTSRTEIKADTELKKYTSPMQEEALDYMESLKKSGVFEKYDNVYVTGHSKGGNEATLVTMVYPDLIDRCISGDGQGFSPEFVRYMKKTLGPEKFAEIQDKMYGFHANNDYVNVLGVSVIKDENKIYFIPEIKLESVKDLAWNHLANAMVNEKTGKIAQVSEQGALGKFVAKVSEKLMKINQKDREDAAIIGMSPLQYLYAHEPVTSVNPNFLINWSETFIDKADVVESFGNGITILGNIIGETLTEKEGEDLVRYIVDEFGDKNIWIKDLGKAYDSLDYGDKAPELIEKFISDIEEELQGLGKDYLNKYLKDYTEDINIYMHRIYEIVGDDKYKSYGTSDLGTVAINYAKTKELVNILDEMNDLVEGSILPEMEDIADTLRRLSFWRVEVRDWTDIKDSIEKSNNTRKRFKERVINYYNSCEIMEAKFVAGMYGGK